MLFNVESPVIQLLIEAKTGETFLIPEIEMNTWWTNLPEEPKTVVELYHRHGTSEQFHSELKTDIGLERLPLVSFKPTTSSSVWACWRSTSCGSSGSWR